MRRILFSAILSFAVAIPATAQTATAPATGANPATATSPAATAPTPGYAAHRVYDTKKKRLVDFEAMAADLAKSDLVFLGEQHDDTRTHQLQAAVLEAVARRRSGPTVLALEMF